MGGWFLLSLHPAILQYNCPPVYHLCIPVLTMFRFFNLVKWTHISTATNDQDWVCALDKNDSGFHRGVACSSHIPCMDGAVLRYCCSTFNLVLWYHAWECSRGCPQHPLSPWLCKSYIQLWYESFKKWFRWSFWLPWYLKLRKDYFYKYWAIE